MRGRSQGVPDSADGLVFIARGRSSAPAESRPPRRQSPSRWRTRCQPPRNRTSSYRLAPLPRAKAGAVPMPADSPAPRDFTSFGEPRQISGGARDTRNYPAATIDLTACHIGGQQFTTGSNRAEWDVDSLKELELANTYRLQPSGRPRRRQRNIPRRKSSDSRSWGIPTSQQS